MCRVWRKSLPDCVATYWWDLRCKLRSPIYPELCAPILVSQLKHLGRIGSDLGVKVL